MHFLVLLVLQGAQDAVSYDFHLRFAESSSGDGRGSQANATGDSRRGRVKWDQVLVHGDPDFLQQGFGFVTGHVCLLHIGQYQVIVSAARDKPQSPLGQDFCQGLGIVHNTLTVFFEGRFESLRRNKRPWPR